MFLCFLQQIPSLIKIDREVKLRVSECDTKSKNHSIYYLLAVVAGCRSGWPSSTVDSTVTNPWNAYEKVGHMQIKVHP